MKKNRLILLIMVGICCVLTFAGCTFSDSIKSISFSAGEQAVSVEIGKFNFEDYSITLAYKNGKTKDIPLEEDMISEYDKLKFYQVGLHTLTISYRNCKCEMKIDVKRNGLENLVFEDKKVTYDGKEHSLEVEGNIPADLKIRYPSGNSFINAGTYVVTAVCYGDNYETKTLVATLEIEKAKYDMSGVKFENATFEYDGSPKSVKIEGTLPDDVTVEYKIDGEKGNSKINAGKYDVVAIFSSKNANYAKITEKTAQLCINKKKFRNFDIAFEDKNVVYDGSEFSIEADLGSVPNGIKNTFYSIMKIKDAKGNLIEQPNLENSKNSAVYAGTYVVYLNFEVADLVNFEEVQPKSATLHIARAVYNLGGVFMYGNSVTYDGTEKSISLSGEIPGSAYSLPYHGIEVSYSTRKIKDKNGNSDIQDLGNVNSAVNVGTYEVSAHFSSSDENYEEIDDIVGLLEILVAERKNMKLSFLDLTVDYDGEEHSISVSYSYLPETVTITYEIKKIKNSAGESVTESAIQGNSALEAGTYEIYAVLEDSDENYASTSLTAVLTISEVRR